MALCLLDKFGRLAPLRRESASQKQRNSRRRVDNVPRGFLVHAQFSSFVDRTGLPGGEF